MAVLIYNVTAVLMDEARTVLPGAYVLVEGTDIVRVGRERPRTSTASASTAGAASSCPDSSIRTPMCP